MPPTQTKDRPDVARPAAKRRKPHPSSARRPRSGSGRKATKRVTTEDFIEHLLAEFDITQRDARAIVAALMSFAREALTKNTAVVLLKVGRLEPYWKPTQNYVHPKTGELTRTGRRKLVRFILSQGLKEDL